MDAGWQQLGQLLNGARAGNSRALGQLLEAYRSYLTLLARVQIGRDVQAKVGASDVVQETFLKAVDQFANFRGSQPGEFASWLRAILATTLIDRVHRSLRRQQRDARLERQLYDAIEQSSVCMERNLLATQKSPSEIAIRHEESVRYANILESLPEDYRTVIVLRHFEGLSLERIAVQMGRSADSVHKLWVRGLARFRSLWENHP
jgi:RNA polymerase sigma-70 factor (ECF subfamily)